MDDTKKRRYYNVFFNTHTVSGIAISMGLFVCFLAGAFALFMDNINNWEANQELTVTHKGIDFDRILSITENEGYEMHGRQLRFDILKENPPALMISSQVLPMERDTLGNENLQKMSKKDSLTRAAFFLKVDPIRYEVTAREFNTGSKQLGSFLYELHQFGQIPAVGIYLAGFVALFFMFAILTGIIVHWRKTISNFFAFRITSSIKSLWADAHTSLGVIGLPFQLMYAVTGALYGLAILFVVPATVVLFDGELEKTFEYFAPEFTTVEKKGEPLANRQNINALVNRTLAGYNSADLKSLRLLFTNYDDQNAQLVVDYKLEREKRFYSNGYTRFRLDTGEVVAEKKLGENTYQDSVRTTMGKLHFATYGGFFVKAVYFVLALITCFVILSGVMVWLTAREKKMYAPKARFNRNVGAIFIGACMGLFPAIALFFCLVKVFPNHFKSMATVFFLFWLGYIIYAFLIKSPFKINRHALVLAGILGLLVPIFNGLQSGLWFWKSLPMGYPDSFFVDMGWLAIGAVSLFAAYCAKPIDKKRDMGTSVARKTVEIVRT